MNRADQHYLGLPATPVCPKAPAQILNRFIRLEECWTSAQKEVFGAPKSELCCHHEGRTCAEPKPCCALLGRCWLTLCSHSSTPPACLNWNQQRVMMAPSSSFWILGDRWQQGSQGLSGMVAQMHCQYANMNINQSSYPISSGQHRALELSCMAVGSMSGCPLE